jgi:hypothetical protein
LIKPITIVCGYHGWTDYGIVKHHLSSLPTESTVAFINKGSFGKIIDKVTTELNLKQLSPDNSDFQRHFDFDNDFSNRSILTLSYCNKYLIDRVLQTRLRYQNQVTCFAFHNNAEMGFATKNMIVRCQNLKIKSTVYLNSIESVYNASPLTVCRQCGRDYLNHPKVIETVNNLGNYSLNWICKGDVVKL